MKTNVSVYFLILQADKREVSKMEKRKPAKTGLTTEDADGEATVLRRKHNAQAAVIRDVLG